MLIKIINFTLSKLKTNENVHTQFYFPREGGKCLYHSLPRRYGVDSKHVVDSKLQIKCMANTRLDVRGRYSFVQWYLYYNNMRIIQTKPPSRTSTQRRV